MNLAAQRLVMCAFNIGNESTEFRDNHAVIVVQQGFYNKFKFQGFENTEYLLNILGVQSTNLLQIVGVVNSYRVILRFKDKN